MQLLVKKIQFPNDFAYDTPVDLKTLVGGITEPFTKVRIVTSGGRVGDANVASALSLTDVGLSSPFAFEVDPALSIEFADQLHVMVPTSSGPSSVFVFIQ